MTALEYVIERAVVALAKLRGWWVCKFVAPGLRGVPDRLFIRGGADRCRCCGRPRVVFIEFKRPGEEPTKQQLHRHEELRALGVEVYWTDDKEKALALLA